MCSPSGSCCRIARNAVGAVNSVSTPCSRDHPPERAGVRRPDRLPLVEHRRAAVEERRVDDVRVPDDPADVGRGPVDLARLDVIDVRHRPRERDRVAAVVADDPLRLPGRAGGVEDVERIGRLDRDALRRLRAGDRLRPRNIPPADELRLERRPLEDDAALRLVGRQVDRRIEQRLVGDNAVGLDPARGGDDHLRSGVVDAGRELAGGEPAEDDGVNRADPRAREHRDQRLGDHRHVEDHPVAALDPVRAESAREQRDLVPELASRCRCASCL